MSLQTRNLGPPRPSSLHVELDQFLKMVQRRPFAIPYLPLESSLPLTHLSTQHQGKRGTRIRPAPGRPGPSTGSSTSPGPSTGPSPSTGCGLISKNGRSRTFAIPYLPLKSSLPLTHLSTQHRGKRGTRIGPAGAAPGRPDPSTGPSTGPRTVPGPSTGHPDQEPNSSLHLDPKPNQSPILDKKPELSPSSKTDPDLAPAPVTAPREKWQLS